MFDFTKEVVINSKNWAEANGKYRIHGGGNYDPKFVVDSKIYKTPSQAGALAVLKINAADMVAAISNEQKHFTLNIELSLDRDARGDWGASVFYFKKPMLVDGFAANWEEADKELAKLLGTVLTDYKFVHVLTSDDAAFAEELGVVAPAAGEVAIVGGDYHVKVRKVSLMDYVCDVRCEGSSEEPATVYAGRPENAPKYFVYTPNVVEFGTYNYLLHNLRMPTYENYRFTSPAVVEMPMPGTDYVQYTFMYCVPRPGLGGLSVAGQFNHSTTTHVFFVASALADEFEAEWASKLGSVELMNKIDENGNHEVVILSDENVDIEG
jgi:hypothetical protein